MSETKQTRCPHCTSVFNITSEQLAARGGHVRCGSCLQVFRADQHLVEGEVATITPPPMPDVAPISTPSMPLENTSSMPVMAREQHAPPKPQTTSNTPKKRNKEDESWAMDLLGDLGEELENFGQTQTTAPKKSSKEPTPAPQNKPSTKKPLFDDEISDMLQEAWIEPTEKAHLKGLGEVDKIKANADESWAQALMSELEEEEKQEKAKNYGMELAPQKPKDPPRKKASTENKQRDDAPNEKASAAPVPKEDDLLSFLNNNASISNAPAPTRNIQLPLEIKTQPMISVNWGYWLTWSFMCVFATTLLLVQYVYFNFNELALNDKTRPQMSQLCASLGCKVPEPPNTLLIDIQKLVIRKNPDIPNALQVNAIVFNKADFAQPLPALKLSFLDKHREVTASRIFQPSEYLQSDNARLLRRIPPETPIHIQFDIVSPKVGMNSYKMKPLFK
jgi:predicted Zn finger-like uncharacterized protein